MKQVEMWKWFKLPVDCELMPTDIDGGVDSVSFIGLEVLTGHHAEKVEIAINSYDANQALIAKQSEQIKMLREAILAVVSKSEAFGVPSGVTVSMINCIKALEATKEQA